MNLLVLETLVDFEPNITNSLKFPCDNWIFLLFISPEKYNKTDFSIFIKSLKFNVVQIEVFFQLKEMTIGILEKNPYKNVLSANIHVFSSSNDMSYGGKNT